jgi:predicted nucleic acid-binding protein
MIVVSDTSPIAVLLKIGRVDLLQQLYGEVLIPEAVRDELSVQHPKLPDFFQCVRVSNQEEVRRLRIDLDPGEAEAIVLVKERHADVLLIDETDGRLIAAREGIQFIGLMGVLTQAKHDGFVSRLHDVIQEIEAKTTFRLSEAMKIYTLKNAGEL